MYLIKIQMNGGYCIVYSTVEEQQSFRVLSQKMTQNIRQFGVQ